MSVERWDDAADVLATTGLSVAAGSVLASPIVAILEDGWQATFLVLVGIVVGFGVAKVGHLCYLHAQKIRRQETTA